MNNKDMVNSLYEELSEAGCFSKEDVFNYFSQYVHNKLFLQQFIEQGNFFYEYSKVIVFIKGTSFQDGLDFVYNIYKRAKDIDSAKVMETIIDLQVKISEGYANQLINARIHNGNVDERGEVETKRVFDIIGDNIEKSIKPFLELLLRLVYICEGKEYKKKTLGVLVDELIKYDLCLLILLKTMFLDISISQWRNISKHNDFKYINDQRIKVEYGPADNRIIKYVQLNQIGELTITLDVLKYIFKIINTCWGIDYVNELAFRKKIEAANSEKTKENWIDNLIIQIVETSFMYKLKVEDVELEDSDIRILATTNDLISREVIARYACTMRSLIQYDFIIAIGYDGDLGYVVESVNNGVPKISYNIPFL